MILFISKFRLIIIVITTTLIITALFVTLLGNSTTITLSNSQSNHKNALESLVPLEPEEPIDIKSTPIGNLPLPSKVFPIQDVIKEGKEIQIDFGYNDPDWIRPAYKTYWHSSVSGGRWSYVPRRINYSLHKIFTSYQTTSIYYDFTHELGIWEESKSFDLDNGLSNIALVVMDSNIKKIITYGNQVLVISEPKRTGLQVVEIHHSKIHPIDKDSPIMFQLVTPDGYELDYSLLYKAQR